MKRRASSETADRETGEVSPASVEIDEAAEHEKDGDGSAEDEAKRTKEKARERKRRKKQKKMVSKNRGTVADYFDVYGEDASASIELTGVGHVRMVDVQELVLWILAQNSVMKPRWINVNNKPLVSSVLVAFVPGLTAETLEKRPDALRETKAAMGEPVQMNALEPMVHPLTSSAALLTRPFSKNASKTLKREEKEGGGGEDDAAVLAPSDLALSLETMRNNNYPIPPELVSKAERGGKGGARIDGAAEASSSTPASTGSSFLHMFRSSEAVDTDGFAQTVSFGSSANKAGDAVAMYDMLAIDCEMCTTKNGLELTRYEST